MDYYSIKHPVSSIKNILIFSFSHIGDAVLSTVVISPLQESFPDARLSMLVGPKAWEVFWGDVRLDELIIYDNHGRHAGLKGKVSLIRELRARKFDLVVDLRDSLWSRFCRPLLRKPRLSHPKNRIGAARWGMPIWQRLERGYSQLHAVDRYLRILSNYGVETEGAAPKIQLLTSERQLADCFLSQNGVSAGDIVVGIHPGGGWPYKLWPVKRFAALGDLLSRKHGAKVLVFAGPDEAELQSQMAVLMRSSPIVVKDIGLRELAALIQRCCLYIGNDTGPMHIAAAVGARVIAIFGSTDPGRSGPYGDGHTVLEEAIGCNPCHPGAHPGGCKRGKCLAMEAVSLQQVTEAVERNLEHGRESYISC